MTRLSLIPVVFLLILAGCVSVPDSREIIYSAPGIEVYPDSIVRGQKEYHAISPFEITHSWKTDSASVTSDITFTSGSRMADAQFVKALTELPGLTSPSTLDIWMSLALLDPERSMSALRLSAPSQSLRGHRDPAVISDGLWATAAWEVFCVTGDRDWLREAWNTISPLLTSTSSTDGLICGIPEYLSPIADYFPSWMQTVDLMQIRSLGVNVMHYMTLSAAASMAHELGLKDAERLRQQAASLRNAINDTFWDPALSRYGQYLYGDLYPILSTITDNLAEALCSISGVATGEMARASAVSLPVLPEGLPLTYPSITRHTHIIPTIQALHGIAAAMTREPYALRQAVGSTWLLSLDESAPAAWPALLLRGLLGLSCSSEGMHISPVIPAIISSDRCTLSGLRFREAIFDISVQGTGDRIASITIDDTPVSSPVIPAGLKGRHSVTVTLSGNSLQGREIVSVKDADAPAIPKVYWDNDREATILNHQNGIGYQVYINGVMTETIHSVHFNTSGGGTQVIDFVPVTTETSHPLTGFSPRSHVSASPSDIISVPATSITPRRAPLRLIKNKEIATKYIELAARHNTRLTFYVNAPSSGNYFLRIHYTNGTSETAARTVEVNSRTVGTLYCPPVRANDWITTHPSTTLTVPLREGPNKLSLYYVNTTILLNEIRLLKQ